MTQTHYWPLWRESSMTDQCHRCTMRGDFAGCKATPCNIHESWHVEQLNATISRLRDALSRYAYHEEDCAAVDRGLSNCDCGYDALLAALGETK